MIEPRPVVRPIGSMVLGWVACLLVAACGSVSPDGAPPSEIKSVIDRPYDNRIFFRDGEMKHVVTLYDDGSYLFKSGTDVDGVLSTREGQWTWKKTGAHQAELMLDRDHWRLMFVSPDSAVAVNQSASGRTHAFQFEPIR